MLKLIDNFPFPSLILMTIMLAVIPYPMQEMPHSLEKLQMLFAGQLSRPLDIFDLVMHTMLIFVLLIKLYRHFFILNKQNNPGD